MGNGGRKNKTKTAASYIQHFQLLHEIDNQSILEIPGIPLRRRRGHIMALAAGQHYWSWG